MVLAEGHLFAKLFAERQGRLDGERAQVGLLHLEKPDWRLSGQRELELVVVLRDLDRHARARL